MEKIILEAVDYDYLGRGISYKDNKTYFIKNLLKGEIGECIILKEKSNLLFGVCEKVLKKSPNRSDYVYEDITNLSHLNTSEQLYFQERILKKTLDKFKVRYQAILPIVYADYYIKYRNKATFHLKNNNYSILGNYFNDTNEFAIFKNITIPDRINKLVLSLNQYFKTNKIKLEYVSKFTFRINDFNKIMMVIYSSKKISHNFYNNFINEYSIVSVYNVVKNIEFLLYGDKYLTYNINNIKYDVGATSFFQVNTSVIAKMYDLIKEETKDSKVIIDAFSGISSISRYISNSKNIVYSIEKNKNACDIAKNNISKNIKIINADFFKVYDNYLKLADTLIIDPPRDGLNINLCNIIKSSDIKKIIYLSCNMRTLTRDLQVLQERYNIKKIIPIKNFWQTAECETLAILSISD